MSTIKQRKNRESHPLFPIPRAGQPTTIINIEEALCIAAPDLKNKHKRGYFRKSRGEK